MTRAMSQARGAYQAARALRSLLQELFSLSLRQMELLDREDYDALDHVIERKSDLLQELPLTLNVCHAQGWELHNPATFPADRPCAGWIREAAGLASRLQAHEKYCLGEMIARRSRVGERLTVLLGKRNAAAGYRVPLSRGNMIDAAR